MELPVSEKPWISRVFLHHVVFLCTNGPIQRYSPVSLGRSIAGPALGEDKDSSCHAEFWIGLWNTTEITVSSFLSSFWLLQFAPKTNRPTFHFFSVFRRMIQSHGQDNVDWSGISGFFLAGIFSANAVCVVASCIHDFDAFLFLFSSFESDMLLSPSAWRLVQLLAQLEQHCGGVLENTIFSLHSFAQRCSQVVFSQIQSSTRHENRINNLVICCTGLNSGSSLNFAWIYLSRFWTAWFACVWTLRLDNLRRVVADSKSPCALTTPGRLAPFLVLVALRFARGTLSSCKPQGFLTNFEPSAILGHGVALGQFIWFLSFLAPTGW